ncbi:MAG: universal stress protein [Bacteroidetes bacterium 4484_249]|nr:MAG: universal stress protein [Bacteroidetes bacterium 4484_249]
MKLLVAIDFSEVTDKITAKVKELALKVNAKIWLIHVVQPEPDFVGYDVGPETERDFMAKKFHEKHVKIQNIAKDLEKEGIKTTPLLVQGPTVETILNQAEKLNVDIIVSGSHGHGAMFRLLVGSISEGLLHNSSKPLLIIPARK